MQPLSFKMIDLGELAVITPFYCEDSRGYFLKNFEQNIFRAHNIHMEISEAFESWSTRGVLRGMHFQSKRPQAKLVRAIVGKIFDVAVDIRQNSATAGQWRGTFLSQENRQALYIPPGFAHGFLTVSEEALVSYQCSGEFLKEYDTGIRWDDPDINISWPLEQVDDLIVSERDQKLMSFIDFTKNRLETQP